MCCIISPLRGPVPALRLRRGVCLAVDERGLLRLEGGGARDVVGVEGEHVDPVAVALQRPAQRAVRRPPHLDRPVLKGHKYIDKVCMSAYLKCSVSFTQQKVFISFPSWFDFKAVGLVTYAVNKFQIRLLGISNDACCLFNTCASSMEFVKSDAFRS